MTSRKKKISVVIPTYKRESILKRTLFALNEQSFKDFEVIVVDDGGKLTKELISRLKKQLAFPLIFVEQDHFGPAAARNYGVRRAHGDYVLFIGDDMVPHKDCLLEHHKCQITNPSAAIIGCVEWHPDLRITQFMRFLAPNGPQFSFGAIDDKNKLSFRFFYTANVSLQRKMVVENVFDGDFRDAAGEDIELGYRLQKRGVQFVYCPNAIVFHYHEISVGNFLDRNEKVVASYKLLFQKHPEIKNELVPTYIHLKIFLFKITALVLSILRMRENKLFFKCVITGDFYNKIKRII